MNAIVHENASRSAPRAVIALGGGGARGLAHLGAMEAIGEAGVQTERIVGVSIGSLIGALCAVDSDIHRVQARAIELLSSPVFSNRCRHLLGSASRVTNSPPTKIDEEPGQWFMRWYTRLERMMRHGHRVGKMIGGPSLLANDILAEAIETLLPDMDLCELASPLSVVAVDLTSGQTIVLERGSLRKAVLASTAIPGFFPPVEWDDMLLCDIGILDSMPLTIAESYPSEMTIAVDVSGTVQPAESFGSAFEVMMRMEEIGERLCRRNNLRSADTVIRPNVGCRPWYDFTNPDQLIQAGRVAGRSSMQNRMASGHAGDRHPRNITAQPRIKLGSTRVRR